jgi:hypothetical protein
MGRGTVGLPSTPREKKKRWEANLNLGLLTPRQGRGECPIASLPSLWSPQEVSKSKFVSISVCPENCQRKYLQRIQRNIKKYKSYIFVQIKIDWICANKDWLNLLSERCRLIPITYRRQIITPAHLCDQVVKLTLNLEVVGSNPGRKILVRKCRICMYVKLCTVPRTNLIRIKFASWWE